MVTALLLLLAAGVVLVAVDRCRAAWRKAEADADPELLYWLAVSSTAGVDRRAQEDRRRQPRGQDRRAG